jgi:glutathione S-transferase
MPLVLHTDAFWISPYVFSVFVALEEKNLPFTTRAVDLSKNEQHQPLYEERSITARVPTLEDDGFALSESSAIVEYLEERFPPPRFAAVLPTDLRQRARSRQVMAWIRSDLMPIRDERPTHTMFYARAEAPLSPQARGAVDKLYRAAGMLLPEGANILFDSFSIADAELAFMLHRLILNGHDVPGNLRSYAESHWMRPSVQKFLNRSRPKYVAY